MAAGDEEHFRGDDLAERIDCGAVALETKRDVVVCVTDRDDEFAFDEFRDRTR